MAPQSPHYFQRENLSGLRLAAPHAALLCQIQSKAVNHSLKGLIETFIAKRSQFERGEVPVVRASA